VSAAGSAPSEGAPADAQTGNRRFVLARRVSGLPQAADFRLETAPLPMPGDGQVLVRNRFISVDPGTRGRLGDRETYAQPLALGEVIQAASVGTVETSANPRFKVGDWVAGAFGWQEWGLSDGRGLRVIPANGLPPSTAIGVLGIPGLTAYFGLLDVGQPKEGDTVVVSGAAGATGSVVGQIAKLKGCTVIGIAGGDAKCQLLVSELGFDHAINYKKEAVGKALRAAAPKGIDVYFDNVGGDILEACLFGMNNYGRIACCGAVSQYDGAAPAHGPRGIPGLIVVKRLTMQGFILTDFNDRREQALADLQSWVAQGKIKVREDILSGLENTPQALIGLLAGENIGKRMVRVS